MATKVYTIILHYRNGNLAFRGSLDYLVDAFSLSLSQGHFINRSIPLKPKSIKGLLTALNDSAMACQRYNDYYTLVAE